jgi:hypothetical protein
MAPDAAFFARSSGGGLAYLLPADQRDRWNEARVEHAMLLPGLNAV